MRIELLNKNGDDFSKSTSVKSDMVFVKVSNQEALEIIHSLSGQLVHKNANYNRIETYAEDNTYFTIAITD